MNPWLLAYLIGFAISLWLFLWVTGRDRRNGCSTQDAPMGAAFLCAALWPLVTPVYLCESYVDWVAGR